jgi:hypothetical protein
METTPRPPAALDEPPPLDPDKASWFAAVLREIAALPEPAVPIPIPEPWLPVVCRWPGVVKHLPFTSRELFNSFHREARVVEDSAWVCEECTCCLDQESAARTECPTCGTPRAGSAEDTKLKALSSIKANWRQRSSFPELGCPAAAARFLTGFGVEDCIRNVVARVERPTFDLSEYSTHPTRCGWAGGHGYAHLLTRYAPRHPVVSGVERRRCWFGRKGVRCCHRGGTRASRNTHRTRTVPKSRLRECETGALARGETLCTAGGITAQCASAARSTLRWRCSGGEESRGSRGVLRSG